MERENLFKLNPSWVEHLSLQQMGLAENLSSLQQLGLAWGLLVLWQHPSHISRAVERGDLDWVL